LRKKTIILLAFFFVFFLSRAQENSVPDFIFGNAVYYNLDVGETVIYNQTEIELIRITNQYNQFKIGSDTLWLKVSRRTLPSFAAGLRVFVADNIIVKKLTDDNPIHGLLKKDVLICLSDAAQPLLDPNRFTFPVSFNDGFMWNGEEDHHLFSYLGKDVSNGKTLYRSHEGIDFELDDAKGIEKHWLVAFENSAVVWIEENKKENNSNTVAVLLQSQSNPQLFYFYDKLYKRSLEVRKGQNLIQGELIGTAWGDSERGYVHFSVLKSDTIPSFKPENFNVVSFFPQLHELYYRNPQPIVRRYSRGAIDFETNGKSQTYGENNLSFEEYSGKGWIFDKWNPADKIMTITKKKQNSIRLNKVLFNDSPAECTNPENWYEYEINVYNGVYRIRTKMGDSEVATWQRLMFEDVDAGTLSLAKGEFKWTSERVIKVSDNKLTVRIYVDESGKLSAGISEIVFQRAD